MKYDYSLAFADDYVDNDNNWTTAEHTINGFYGCAALDAHWGMEKIHDYFLYNHGRNSWKTMPNGQPAKMACYVNTDLTYFNRPHSANAFWNGNVVVCGKGEDDIFGPYTAIDIVAHEFGHGITQATLNLITDNNINYAECGSLIEALGDIWGACVEYYATGNAQKSWIHGEDVAIWTSTSTRYLSNPKMSGPLPDTYYGQYYASYPYPNLSYQDVVHQNLSIVSHWFYRLAQGGVGVNDLGNSYNFSGIGMENAAKIVYKAMTMYSCPNTPQNMTFVQFRERTIDAVNALLSAPRNTLPNNSLSVVIAAWNAVGVGDVELTYNGTGYIDMLPSDGICFPNYDADVYAEDISPSTPENAITWACSPNIILTEGNYGYYNHIEANTGITSGNAWIKIYVYGVLLDEKHFKIGVPTSVSNTSFYIYPTLYSPYVIRPPKLSGIYSY